MPEPARRPLSSYLVWAPLAFVVLMAIGWTGFWFFAAHRAEATVTTWIAQEAKAGRIHSCAKRTVGGYPFRIEMRCTDPRTEIRAQGKQPIVLQAHSLLGVAQIYQPDLVIAEITGPMTITAGPQQPAWQADWKLAHASVRGLPFAFQRLSLVIDGAQLHGTGEAANQSIQANRLAFHMRLSPGAVRTNAVFDMIAKASGLVANGIPHVSAIPIDFDATGVLRSVDAVTPKPLLARLRDWQAAGGTLELTQARLSQGDAIAIAKGSVGLTTDARPDGDFSIAMTGLDHVLADLLGEKLGSQVSLLTGLAMLGGGQRIDGKRAISMPLRFRDGTIFFGPLKVGQIGPLY
jgi:hypothetical protein